MRASEQENTSARQYLSIPSTGASDGGPGMRDGLPESAADWPWAAGSVDSSFRRQGPEIADESGNA